jgi:nucleoside-diphosphate-sugar epimerase
MNQERSHALQLPRIDAKRISKVRTRGNCDQTPAAAARERRARYAGRVEIANLSIAVTGATGFLGGYLVNGLRARGAHVIAVVRDRAKAERLLPAEVELRVADLADRTALARSFRGCDAVIANAAVISFVDPGLTMRTNVEGTRNVFEALVECGVRRAVAISSSAAYPMSFAKLSETTSLRALTRGWYHNAYGISKAEAERVAWRIARAHDLALTTFRPCGITGPHDPMLIAAIERVMRAWVTPFPAYTKIGVVHAADVTDAVARALLRPELARDKAYNLQGSTATLWQIADAWRRAGGRSPLLRLPVPVPLALHYDDTLARRELGWEPRSLDAILSEAVAARGAPMAQRASTRH